MDERSPEHPDAQPDHMPIDRSRSAPVNVTDQRERLRQRERRPIPGTERAAIGTMTFGASAQPTDAKAKIAIPIAQNFLRSPRPTRVG